MIDANTEIQRLRQKLSLKGLPNNIIDQICDEAAMEINMAASDLLADAMEEAVNAGGDAMSEDFIDEVRAVRRGPMFEVGTDSGRTDFSEPPFPQLPSLLKNGKVAKDGSIYKVIPMRSKHGGSNNTNTSVSKTTEAAHRSISEARNQAKEDRDSNNSPSSSPNAFKGMSTIAAMQNISSSRNKQPKMRRGSDEAVTSFRTASSKQDPNTQWVQPGRKVDMSGALSEINSNLQYSIDRVIEEVINKHEGQY